MKTMNTSKPQKQPIKSLDQLAVQLIQPATASLASPKATRQGTAIPSDTDIAAKAYDIWLSRGQEMGNDQQHWFEAKRQLQQG